MCDMRKCECATRTAYEGDTQLMWVLRWTQFRSCVQYSWEQKEESLLFLDCQLTPIPFDYQPHSSSHHFPPLMFWPHQYHLLLFQTSHKTSPHPLPCPELFRSSRLRGQYGSGARDSLIHGLSSLSWPPVLFYHSSVPFFCPPHKHSPSPLIIWPTFYSLFAFSRFLRSFVSSSCSWMPYWLGFLFTFTHILFSPSLYSFCSPVYCNAQTSLIHVFVSVYCFPKCLHLL